MSGNELNKIFGAVVGAAMVFFTVTFAVEKIYGTGHKDHHHDKLAYALDLGDDSGEPEPEPVVVEVPLPELMAAADVASGEKVFKKCQSCHTINEGGASRTGPALWGVMGRPIGGYEGYSFSDSLAGLDASWDWEAMNGFLTSPKDWAPGTKMKFAGLRKASDRADVMAYLNANTGTPLALPTE